MLDKQFLLEIGAYNPDTPIETSPVIKHERAGATYDVYGEAVATLKGRYADGRNQSCLMFEDGATNIIGASSFQTFNSSVWLGGGGATFTNTPGQVDPLGTNTAYRLVSSAGVHVVHSKVFTNTGAVLTIGMRRSHSIWIRNLDPVNAINVDTNFPGPAAVSVTYLEGWKYVKLENSVADIADTSRIRINTVSDAVNLDALVWRPQTEDSYYCTSWTDSTARAADCCTFECNQAITYTGTDMTTPDLLNAGWSKLATTVTKNQTDPFGVANNAFLLDDGVATAYHLLENLRGPQPQGTWTISLYVKPVTATSFCIQPVHISEPVGTISSSQLVFSSGAVSANGRITSAKAKKVGNGWWFYTVTFTTTMTNTDIRSRFCFLAANNYTGINRTAIVYGVRMEAGSSTSQEVYSLLDSEEGTVDFWMKSIHTPTASGYLFNIYSGANSSFYVYRTGNSVSFVLGNGTSSQTISKANALILGTWIHVALTWSKYTGEYFIYINGSTVAYNPTIVNFTLPQQIHIGNNEPGNAFSVNACMENLRFSNRARTTAEMKAAYESPGPPVWDANTLGIYLLNKPGEQTLRFSCQPGYTDHLGRVWYPRVMDPGLYKVDLFSGSKTFGSSNHSYGEVLLSNPISATKDKSGPLDDLKQYVFNGRSVKLFIGSATGLYPTDFTQSYTAVVEQVMHKWDNVEIVLRGRQVELDKPLNTVTFAGTNTSDTTEGLIGIEGVEADLKDKPKPVLIGRVYNISPILCNTIKLIYAVNPGQGIEVDGMGNGLHVYDNGVELFRSGKVLTDANIQNNALATPPPGCYVASESGYIRLGSTPQGTITCDACCLGYGLISTPANMIRQVLTISGNSSMIDEASFAAYSALDGYEGGVYINDNTKTVSQVIDEILSPKGSWYFGHTGSMMLGLTSDPSTMTSVYAATSDVNIGMWDTDKVRETKQGAPASKVTVRYGKNYTVQTNPAGACTPSRKALIATQWRDRISDTLSIPDPLSLSQELIIDTARTTNYPSIVGLYTTPRELLFIDILELDFLNAALLLPGQCITVNLKGRFNYTTKKVLIVGILINYVSLTVRLTVWS
jgi:hypothetical protein